MLVTEDLLPEERLDRIRSRLVRDGRVSASDLAREFHTSEDTIRRDLRDLAAAGFCRRVYGGALRSPVSEPLRTRLDQRPGAKAALARAAARLVVANQTVFIDTGSTNCSLAAALPDDVAFTVVTNAPAVAVALATHTRCSVIQIGGRIDPATGGSFGTRALRDLDGLRPDLFFAGTCAVSAQHGLAVFDGEEAAFKRRLVDSGARLIVLATTEKLATSAPFGFASLGEVDTLVLEFGVGFDSADAYPDLHILHAAAATEAKS
ncbi:DeoR/GlpR family DNA-binding transcription regulator [Lichenifustis flavocetrariae]|uniref:DeoR/GlpR family DNA-binding transcription regulator n=1 Tax=Lichenifustis flavocetrariae TaxID=2949735 RepID=A0AA41YXZ3_9HYPH|nr:DeoR/GlpR family DNA-binding transcription regulator [Lichenifustis flavocetrariae]MCW6510194.1 DeoR/GlpR family DNA-binding transcription regulator [Lichenifustis flavocetrariae]